MKKITSALLCAALMLSLACPALAAEQSKELDAAVAPDGVLHSLAGDDGGPCKQEDRARASWNLQQPAPSTPPTTAFIRPLTVHV